MSGFPQVLAGLRRDGETFAVHLTPNWMQGRTAYGGASAALALAAAQARWPELPPLRSAQIAFVGPLGADLRLTPTMLRAGRSASFVRVEVRDGDTLGASATLLFAPDRDSHVDHPAPRHPALPPRGAIVEQPFPQFAANFALAEAESVDPARPRLTRWARLKERAGLDPMVELLLIADILPPAAMALFRQFGPISTVSWHLDVTDPAPLGPDGWLYSDAEAERAVAGISAQAMRVFDEDGRLVAAARQSVALFA